MSTVLEALKNVYNRYFGGSPRQDGPGSPKEAVEKMVDRLEPSQVMEVLEKAGLDPQQIKIKSSFVQLNISVNKNADLVIVRILDNPTDNDLRELLECLALDDLQKRDLHRRARHKDRRIRDGAENELRQHVRKCCGENNIDRLHRIGRIFARYDKEVASALAEVDNNLEEAKDSIKLLCLAGLFNKADPSPYLGAATAEKPGEARRLAYVPGEKCASEQAGPAPEEKKTENIFEALARICGEVADNSRRENRAEKLAEEQRRYEELAEQKEEVDDLARLHPEMRDEILRKYMPGFMKSALFSALTDTQQMEIEAQCAERKDKESRNSST